MMDPQTQAISKLTGMFLDKDLERRFEDSYLNRSKNQLRRIAQGIGMLFFIFIFYDFSANKSNETLVIICICRFIFLFLGIFFYYRLDFFLKSSTFFKITVYELIYINLFFIIVFVYETSHFLIQAFAINVIIFGVFFLIPNILHYRIFIALYTLAGFLVVTMSKYTPAFTELIAIYSYLLIAIFINTISVYSLGKYMRLDYVYKQYFKELSTKDPLTNTYNRLKFNESLSSEIELAKRYGNTFSLIMFDIDHFKNFNDKKGHSFGDKILVEVSNLVKESIRGVDIFARWGGEEFVILLPHTVSDEATALAERLRRAIYKESLKKEIPLTCSFGVTSFYNHDNHDVIMERVDRALYKAKGSGRNVVVTELYSLERQCSQ
ncbi:GGDEF domain-containing protein [Desulfosporosinus sp. HMP52]|uniref:GGDEF domain-containing protein n=1 Tax=Desulfosporosinus sp. HMP52 TaxID=1487923 RepID=UPI000691A238|nr:GGDEF domain-containing protein [Desulfosporosinus sp. HMP52]